MAKTPCEAPSSSAETCRLLANGRRCGRRVQKLYLPPGCKFYGCRQCYNLGYSSQCEDEQIRARTKAEKIRLRLGGSPSLDEPLQRSSPLIRKRQRIFHTAKPCRSRFR